MSKLSVTRIPHMNVIVLKQSEGSEFFIASPDSVIITPSSFSNILKFLVLNKIIHYKIVEGILEEFYSMEGINDRC